MSEDNDSAVLEIIANCPFGPATDKALAFSVYTIFTPIYFAAGIVGHVLCLLAYYHQSKKETAYWQQIFVALSETCQIVTTTVFIVFMKWLSDAIVKPDWYQHCYACVWFTCHLSAPLPNMFMTSSLLLSLSMVADRLYAIARPIQYRNGNKKRQHMISGGLCLFLGISTTMFDCFQADIQPADEFGRYSFKWHDPNPRMTVICANLRSALRVGATILLIVCNASLIYIYRSRLSKVGQMAIKSTKDDKRKEKEKLLMLIGVVQSLSMSLSMGYHSACFGMNNLSLWFQKCGYMVMWPSLDFIVELSEIINFYLMIATSPAYRKMIGKILPSFCKKNESNVAAINIGPTSVISDTRF